MIDPTHDPQEDFAEEQEREYQNAHYHDEDPEIADDEDQVRHAGAPPRAKKKPRIPPPRSRYDEE
jgi:hypothetical protein